MNAVGLPAQDIIFTRTIQSSSERVYAAFITDEGWCQCCCEKVECDAHIGGYA